MDHQMRLSLLQYLLFNDETDLQDDIQYEWCNTQICSLEISKHNLRNNACVVVICVAHEMWTCVSEAGIKGGDK